MNSTKNKFTLKITISYLLLIILGVIASYYIYSEVQEYIATETTTEKDNKLLKTNSFLAQLYEAESLSKLALQTKSKVNFTAYEHKIDSLYTNIEELKTLTESDFQHGLLDSLRSLLNRKVTNINALRSIRLKNQTGTAINSALKEFDKLEESLGIIKPEELAPNLDELSPKAQSTIKKVADYLNANVPEEGNAQQKAQKMDSVVQVSKNLLKDVQQENTQNENSLAVQETNINRTDIELSQQLRTILSSFEQEIIMNSLANSIKKESLLKRSIRLAVIAAILGFLVVAIFTFILNRDFWKANLYRDKLEKEKAYSESLLKSREQLIATVSHDLRTPLNTISGYATIIEESNDTKKNKEYIIHIKSATTYVNNLVNDLLDFSQLEAGKMVAKNSTFRLDKLIQESSRNIASQYTSKDIELILKLDDSLKQPIHSDAFRLRQIISNLLGNAFKFTEKGCITLTGRVTESKVLILKITDTGIGISKEKQELIFKEFTQAESDTDKKYGGYGLGLTITKKLTELLEGKILLESEINKGSTFTLHIPIEFSQKPEQVAQENTVLSNLKMIVFDDDTSFLKLIGEMLKSEGIEARLFSNFNEYKPNENFDFDVVLTDIEMPTITGYEIVTLLKSGEFKNFINQPILAMTGRRDLTLEHFTEQGFSNLIRKPFSNTELLQKLHVLFNNANEIIPAKDTRIATDYQQLYSLNTLKMFLGDDQNAIDEVLLIFKKDTKENALLISNAVATFDILQVNKVAHRMLPMFRQLEIKNAIPILETFETLNSDDFSDQQLNAKNIELQKEIKKLSEMLSKEIAINPNHNS
ncbi:signal transduction histidine kinase [Maribacter spongiicola]|uniref:histidine kinase n=1 Tax=Maribacter spongiicola TaxID=1206753 RepID=A0A4R7JUX1_9FLAO|nr:ATP-binding protein [Maribacter spongiicola]TDT41875.1 signal transduction histidine kinase [Maribacter spongiicola]